MGGPQHGQAFFPRQPVHMLDQKPPRRHVQADGGFVQQQQTRAVQQGAGDFHPAAVAAIEQAHPLAPALAQRHALQFGVDARAPLAAAQAMQRGKIRQVLLDGEIQVQRRLLKHHAQPGHGRGGQGLAKQLNRPALAGQQPGEQAVQRALAGAIGPEQHAKLPLRHIQADVIQRQPCAIAVAEPGDVQGGRAHGLIATPHG